MATISVGQLLFHSGRQMGLRMDKSDMIREIRFLPIQKGGTALCTCANPTQFYRSEAEGLLMVV